MIHIDNLNGEQSGRLTEILLGRSDFAAFAVDAGGRRLSIWVMSDEALARIENRMDVAPSPAAEEFVPAAPKPVAVTSGERAATPGSVGPN